jgi:MSHA type pilus biogenesis protein MshL
MKCSARLLNLSNVSHQPNTKQPMKIHHRLRHSVLTHLAAVAGLGLIAPSAGWNFSSASAAQKKEPTFSDVPGVTSPAPAPVTNTAPAPVVQPPTEAPVVIQPPVAPPVELDTKSKTVYSFQATDLDLRSALATFAKANNLNIVPDNDVAGTVTLDIRDLPLDLMMRALLEASDCSWQQQGGLIRVHSTETRIFSIDYLRLSRAGIGRNSATLGSGTMGGGGIGGGGLSGGGGGGIGGGGGGTAGGGGGNIMSSGTSSVNVTADNTTDFWKELVEELKFMLTPSGQTSLSINKTAGIIQVTDRPSALRRMEAYLSSVRTSIHRQVDIEARLYDVTLNNQFQFGIDWVHIAKAYGGTLGFGGATLPVANGGAQLLDSSIGGINRFGVVGSSGSTAAGGNLSSLVFQNFNTQAAVNALEEQGTVQVISTPRLRTLNNQTALIKVGEEVPFFNSSTSFLPGLNGQTALQQSQVTSITVGTILSITPQISGDDWVSLDISPVLTSLKAIIVQPSPGGGTNNASTSGAAANGNTTAPDLDTKQASTIVRVRDGTTVVIGGLIQTQKAKNETKVPFLGDIPLLGKLFTGTFTFDQKKELVIFVTPHIIREGVERPLPELRTY